MKKKTWAIILNSFVFLMALLGTIFMIIGFQFMAQSKILESNGWDNFKYFTVDSNVFVGITSFLYLLFIFLKKEIPHWLSILKFSSCVGVLLTMLVTACFLAPTSQIPFFWFYQNSNLFFHFLVPLLATISIVCFEEHSLSFKETFYGVCPMALYAIYYIGRVIPHIQNGVVSYEYDFYGFLRGGSSSIFFVIPIMFIVTYVIGLALWGCMKKTK